MSLPESILLGKNEDFLAHPPPLGNGKFSCQSSCICIPTRPLERSRRRKCGNLSSILQSVRPGTRLAGVMDTTGRTTGAAATKHFERASTSERNQRAAEQRVGVPASPFVYEWGHGGGESGTTGDPSECRLDRCSRRRDLCFWGSLCWSTFGAELAALRFTGSAAPFARAQVAWRGVAWRGAFRAPKPPWA